uniref:LAGLIDADG_2 domain-containing protein n=1 Tax=Panagrellus redivivus TaxID=6233 RepID=A0A7E4ZRR9_PANRE
MAGYFDGFGDYREFRNSEEDEHQACSVVFKGIAEYGSTDEAENKREDYATVMEIVRWLGIYDEIPQAQVRRSLNGISNRRNIIVTLNSPKSRELLLQRGRIWLRTADRLRCITIEPAVLPIELHARRQANGLARVPVGLS